MRSRELAGGALLTLLAVVFTIGLTYASIELPARLHAALEHAVPTPGGDSHADDTARLQTELFLRHYHLRTVGAVSFALMVVLIVAGFALGRTRMATAGAVMLFLPVFAQFATVMFFLAGLGLLNLVWLPVLDLGFDVGRLGDIVYLPYRAAVSLGARLGVDLHGPLVLLLVGGGLLLFAVGTLAWFVARTRGRDVADSCVYRISRHPQYLGWLIWSYGMLVALERIQYPRRSWGIPTSLPWLLSAVIIIGVALLEEGKMRRLFGVSYETYRARTPFLLPLPALLSRVLTAPSRLLFGSDLPARRGEIAAVLGLYTALLIGLSCVSLEVRAELRLPVPARSIAGPADRSAELVEAIRRADTWHTRAPLVAAVEAEGEPALGPLLDLLGDPDPELRQLAARSLGRIGSPSSVGPLLEHLTDPDANVRHWAAWSLGELRAREAVAPLTGMLEDETGTMRAAAAGALGRIGDEAAVGPLVRAAADPRPWTRVAVVEAFGAIGSDAAVEPLLDLLDDRTVDVHVRRAADVSLSQIGSPRAEPALRRALDDSDFEVRIYAAEALRALEDAPRWKAGMGPRTPAGTGSGCQLSDRRS